MTIRDIVSRRIRLRVGIAVTFAGIMIPVIGGMVAYLYRANADMAARQASEAMEIAARSIAESAHALLAPVARVVEATALQARQAPGMLRDVQGLEPFYRRLTQMSHLYGIHVGFQRDGAFYQIVHFPAGVTEFGPHGRRPPDDARFAVRVLDSSGGAKADSYLYLSDWYNVTRVERGQSTYDPRVRPWYKKAMVTAGTAMSPVYVFASTGRPGLTLTHRIATHDGSLIGAIGADISLDSLAGFLALRRIGRNGRVFIVDGDGLLIGHPNPEISVREVEGNIEIVPAVSSGDSVVAGAVRLRDEGAGDRFRALIGPDEKEYLVAFEPIPSTFGQPWTAGVIVELDEIVAPFRQASIRILEIGAAVVAVTLLVIFMVSRALTRQLQAVVAETDRIRGFDLTSNFALRSRILEIDNLVRAVVAMKNGLVSFGAYVPKALVKNIVTSETPIAIGGERRKLTVMFSDIQDFTRGTESMAPEDVLAGLSDYFKSISAVIHRHGGTIDKFIGDAAMAIWNAPMSDRDHVVNACRALLECRALTREAVGDGSIPTFTRFGLHTCEAVVGNIGSVDRMQYTALGAGVNLTSRVEALNKVYNTQLLVTDAIADAVEDRFLFRLMDRVVPAGLSEPVGLFELVGALDSAEPFAATPEDRARIQSWAACMEAYFARDWPGAIARFQAFQLKYPNDDAAKLFIHRCRKYAVEPPPADWNGAQIFKRK